MEAARALGAVGTPEMAVGVPPEPEVDDPLRRVPIVPSVPDCEVDRCVLHLEREASSVREGRKHVGALVVGQPLLNPYVDVCVLFPEPVGGDRFADHMEVRPWMMLELSRALNVSEVVTTHWAASCV